jgi:putative endonuclease
LLKWGEVRGREMREEKSPAVYILASRKYGVLYIGVTSALWNRVAVHKKGDIKGFTKQYNIKLLVWYEHHISMEAAIKREKQFKKWNRVWKINLIEEFNPNWNDLHELIDYNTSLVEENTDARLRGHDGL